MPHMRSPADIARKWQRNLSGSVESIRSGVAAVDQSPTEKAAARSDQYLIGVQNAVDSGKYQAGLRSVSLEQWKQAMLDKGVPRIASGAAAGEPKMQAFLQEFLPYVEQGQRMLDNMPRGSLAENIARSTAMIEHLANFHRTR
jgi:hypothetical protein